MNYQALARKWRPKKFSDVVGQQHIIQAIINSFSLQKIHHAYILIGTRGSGKTTIARLFAKSLNCEKGIISVTCGKCKNCQDIELDCFIDFIEIDAASRTKVEETREFLDTIQYMPSVGRFKVYLIDEVHMLSKHSFNALLKILEEPPVHVKFILVTTEYKKIPETILSRCLQFYLKPLSIDQIIVQLKYIFNKENIVIESSVLESLAYASKGSMRDALNLSEQAIVLGSNKITIDVINNMFGIVNVEYPLYLIENLIYGNIHEIFNQIDNYSTLGVNWDNVLTEMLIILKKIAINQFLSNSLPIEKNETQDINKRIYKLGHQVTPENIQLYYQIFLLGRRELSYAPNPRVGIEIIMLRALAFKPITTDIMKNYYENKTNVSSINKGFNNNVLKNSDTNNKNYQIVNNDKNTKKLNCINNNVLHSDIKNNKHNFKNIRSNNLISPFIESDSISNTTKELIKARLILTKHKNCNELNKIKNTSDLITSPHKNNITNILKRFSNLKTSSNNNTVGHSVNTNTNHISSSNINYTQKINNNIHNNPQKIIFSYMKEILHQVIKKDPWASQIYHLFLPKSVKKIIMNSWKENIDSNKIYLHVRSDYFSLISVKLKNMIQKSLSKNLEQSIILDIKKNDNTIKKTPLEYIYILYKEKILQTKKEFSDDPYVKTIKTLFDAEFNEDDFKIL